MPRRNDTNVLYDRSLLSSVPDPTRAEKQEGYNVDLLGEGRDRPPDPAPTDQQPLTEGYSPGAVALAHKDGQLENGTKPAKVLWYRTRWGITAIVILIILIIGGVVGGVVGGTHHSSSRNANSTSNGTVGNEGGSGNGTSSNSSTTSSIPIPNAPTQPSTSVDPSANNTNNGTNPSGFNSTNPSGVNSTNPSGVNGTNSTGGGDKSNSTRS